MVYKTLPDVTKDEILDLSMKYVNPGKTKEWIDRGINIVMGKREGYCFWDMDGRKLLDIHLNGGVYNLGHRNPEVIQAMIDARIEQNLTQQDLSQRTGITQADISRIENGTRNPSLAMVKRLAEGLGMQLRLEFIPTPARK